MTGATLLSISSRAVISAPRGSVAPIEKPCGGNGLQNGQAQSQSRRNTDAQTSSQQSVSRIGTEAAPRWHDQRLSAAFVAQVLGQVLCQGAPDVTSARAAYADLVRARDGWALDCSV